MTSSALKKGRYSKLGCVECKRRKIKCDETKPSCWHCQRLEKGCVYLPPKQKSLTKSRSKSNSEIQLETIDNFNITDNNSEHDNNGYNTNDNIIVSLNGNINNKTENNNTDTNNNINQTIINGDNHTIDRIPAVTTGNNISKPPHKPTINERIKTILLKEHESNILNLNGNQNIHREAIDGVSEVTVDTQAPLYNTENNIELMNLMLPESYRDSTINLAQSLNELLTSQISQSNNNSTASVDLQTISPLYMLSNTDYQTSKADGESSPYSISSLLSNSELIQGNSVKTIPKASIPHIKLTSFNLSKIHMEYLQLFFDDFSRVIEPFCPLDYENMDKQPDHSPISLASSHSIHSTSFILNEPCVNPARDVILYYAKKESYVLAAVLACGALAAHRRTNSPADEGKYCGYLAKCMSLLGESLNDGTSPGKRPKGKMEGLIITTLLLTSYNASSNVVKWRPHLETAGRLLMHSAYYPDDDIEFDKIEKETLAFCRTWFFSIEVIAGMSSTWGGTMNDRDWKVMEKWVEEDSELLSRFKIIWKNPTIVNSDVEYNLIFGYSNKLATILGRLSCIQRHARLGEKLKLHEISWFLTRLESKEIKEYCILSNSGYLPKDFKLDPILGIPNEAIERFDDIDSSGDTLYVSWWDICYQAHRMSAIIHALTKLFMLDKDHFLVRNAIDETVGILKFLRTKKKIKSYGLMMFQVCVFLVGKWSTTVEHRSLVSKYFRDLLDFGNIAALYSMRKLERIWRNEDGDQEEEDIINY